MSCSKPASILMWLLVIMPDYNNELHTVNLFYMFASCMVLMYRLIPLMLEPVFCIP